MFSWQNDKDVIVVNTNMVGLSASQYRIFWVIWKVGRNALNVGM
jgi:hypothetical protein